METLHVCKESLNCQNNHHHLSQSFASSTGNRKREKKKKKGIFNYHILRQCTSSCWAKLNCKSLHCPHTSWKLLFECLLSWQKSGLALSAQQSDLPTSLLPLASSQVLQAPVTASYKETWVGGSRATIPMRLHLG